MAKNTATILGFFLIAVGLIGFSVPGFMGMNLTVAHNFLHLASGAAALYFGRKNTPAVARTFCIVIGTLYGLVGLAGLLAGGPDNTLTLIPGELVLGKMDHVVHLFLGAVFLATGLFRRMAAAMPPKH
jgi:hypothetical protein